ncbi:MAG: tripartite tricarboxylate transporter substrate-binding protein [Deltaproteobacteria bacterium]|nr:tripartite tricarboxylate transporter substrate-binding protein [Deltaproteobacteria bacterium]
MRHLTTRILLGALALGLAASLPLSQARAEFPDRNINIVVPFSPGGGYDAIARATARSMKKFVPKGVNIIVKNVTGAAGRRASVFMYRAKPDGYTIAHFQASGMLGDEMLSETPVGFETSKYTWLARVGADPFGLHVSAKGPHKSIADLQKAKRITWGVEGIGVGRWLGSFLAAKTFGIDFHVVAGYRGTGESLPALLRGDFDVWAQPIDHPSVTSYLGTDLRPVVQLDRKRAVNAPEVQTSYEMGYDLYFSDLRAFGGPPGIPEDRAKILEDLLLKAMRDKDYVDWKNSSSIQLVEGPASTVSEDLKYYENLFKANLEEMRKAAKAK